MRPHPVRRDRRPNDPPAGRRCRPRPPPFHPPSRASPLFLLTCALALTAASALSLVPRHAEGVFAFAPLRTGVPSRVPSRADVVVVGPVRTMGRSSSTKIAAAETEAAAESEMILSETDYYEDDDNDDDDDDDSGVDSTLLPPPLRGVKAKKLIECSAFIVLPFSADVAFDAFSDLRRQPSWCKYLHSVEYVGFVDDDPCVDLLGGETDDSDCIPRRTSRWTVGVKGFRFRWMANDTLIDRPHRIEWASTSGLRNAGSVTFAEREADDDGEKDGKDVETEMMVQFAFVAPRVVAGAFRRAGYVRNYVENVLLGNMLRDFRDVVREEDLR